MSTNSMYLSMQAESIESMKKYIETEKDWKSKMSAKMMKIKDSEIMDKCLDLYSGCSDIFKSLQAIFAIKAIMLESKLIDPNSLNDSVFETTIKKKIQTADFIPDEIKKTVEEKFEDIIKMDMEKFVDQLVEKTISLQTLCNE